MTDKLEPLVRPIIGIENRTALEAFDIMADRIRSHFATPANGEQVERVAKAIYDATHVGLRNCYAWEDAWEDHQEHHRDRYYKEARAAILATLPTPTEDARDRVKVLEETLERAKHKLGHVSVDAMNGDNLAITLCTHFDDGEGDEDEHGWTEAATAGCDATLKAIHAMYADVLLTALSNKDTDRG